MFWGGSSHTFSPGGGPGCPSISAIYQPFGLLERLGFACFDAEGNKGTKHILPNGDLMMMNPIVTKKTVHSVVSETPKRVFFNIARLIANHSHSSEKQKSPQQMEDSSIIGSR